MAVTDYLAQKSITFLTGKTKLDVFTELAELLSREVNEISTENILENVWKREELHSTRISDLVAVPHAVIKEMSRTVMVFGISREGISWDARTEANVHLIVMMIGSEHEHLSALRDIAAILQHEEVCKALLQVATTQEAYAILSAGLKPVKPVPLHKSAVRITELTVRHAVKYALEVRASRIVIHIDNSVPLKKILPIIDREDVITVAYVNQDNNTSPLKHGSYVVLPFRELSMTGKIEVALLFLLSQGIIGIADRIVNVSGASGSGLLDSLLLTDVEREFSLFFAGRVTDGPVDLEQQVLARVLQIAQRLAIEGREGKPVGTLFILGDYDHVKAYCQQLIINPFRGYPEKERNILDPSLEETVKEFSRIDGAFVIHGSGTIKSAGTFIKSGEMDSRFIAGLGARHAAAVSITVQTSAVAIAVSESTRKVSLFRSGKRFLEF